jgi:hypothetical protein
MRKKIKNLSIKITRQQKNLKTVSVHYKNSDLILKMIKKAKISRVRVPLMHICTIAGQKNIPWPSEPERKGIGFFPRQSCRNYSDWSCRGLPRTNAIIIIQLVGRAPRC